MVFRLQFVERLGNWPATRRCCVVSTEHPQRPCAREAHHRRTCGGESQVPTQSPGHSATRSLKPPWLQFWEIGGPSCNLPFHQLRWRLDSSHYVNFKLNWCRTSAKVHDVYQDKMYMCKWAQPFSLVLPGWGAKHTAKPFSQIPALGFPQTWASTSWIPNSLLVTSRNFFDMSILHWIWDTISLISNDPTITWPQRPLRNKCPPAQSCHEL